MAASDGLGEEICDAYDRQALLQQIAIHMGRERDAVGDDDAIDGGAFEHAGGSRREDAVRRRAPYRLRALPAAGRRHARHRAAAADEIVENDCYPPSDVTGENIARDLALATPLIHEGFSDGPRQRSLQALAKQLRPLLAAEIGGDDRDLLLTDEWRKMAREQRL